MGLVPPGLMVELLVRSVTAGNIEEELITAGGGISRGTEEQAIEVKEMMVGTVVGGQRESRAKVLIGGL